MIFNLSLAKSLKDYTKTYFILPKRDIVSVKLLAEKFSNLLSPDSLSSPKLIMFIIKVLKKKRKGTFNDIKLVSLLFIKLMFNLL